MNRQKNPKVWEKSVNWLIDGSRRTDEERAIDAAYRIRRYIDCYDLLRENHGQWWSSIDVAGELGISRRAARRTFEHLAAAGVIELHRGIGGFRSEPTKARYVRKTRKEK